MSQTKQHPSAQPVDHVKALASTLEDILKARGVPIGHRNALHAVSALAGHANFHVLLSTLKSLGVSVGHLNALHAVTALAEHPSYKALQARGSQEPSPAAEPGLTLTLSKFLPSLRHHPSETVQVQLSQEAVQDILDNAVQIALAVAHDEDETRFTGAIYEAVSARGLLERCYVAPSEGSLATNEARLAFMEEFGIAVFDDSNQPGCYGWSSPTDASEVSLPTFAAAIADAWDTLEFGVLDFADISPEEWAQMDDARKREVIIEYFEN